MQVKNRHSASVAGIAPGAYGEVEPWVGALFEQHLVPVAPMPEEPPAPEPEEPPTAAHTPVAKREEAKPPTRRRRRRDRD